MREAVVVEAVRTPVGRRNGAYAGTHPAELAAAVLTALVERTGIDPARVDDVILGCVSAVGDQAANIARTAWLAAGLPEEVPATTIDRQCGSSQQAVHFAAQGVIAGAYDLVVAGGVENMTRVPLGCSTGDGAPYAPLAARYGDRLVPQGVSAELIADKWSISREELDAYALASHQRAAAAQDAGWLDAHLVRVGPLERDEGVRRDTSAERLAGLKPAFRPDGRVTAGNSSQISDGASALLIAERAIAEALGLRPLARVAGFALAGADPIMMLTAVIPATVKLLERTGRTLADLDLIEVNEAFASVVLAWAREVGADLDRVNVNGGAIAIGHPLGASGTRVMADLIHELDRRGGATAMQVICEGGGMANATLLERVTG
jgi:acetyl-CoA acyltransferase